MDVGIVSYLKFWRNVFCGLLHTRTLSKYFDESLIRKWKFKSTNTKVRNYVQNIIHNSLYIVVYKEGLYISFCVLILKIIGLKDKF